MPVREVALDRDVRSPRLLPSRASLFSIHFARRAGSIAVLLLIDVAALFLALLAESLLTGSHGLQLWPGLSWVGFLTASGVTVVCAAFGGLYKRRHWRHRLHAVVTAWVVAFVISSALMLLVNPDSLGARWVAVWMLAVALDVAGRWAFDALSARGQDPEGEFPRVLLLGNLDACVEALPTLAALPTEDRVSVVGLVVPVEEYHEARTRRDGAPRVVATHDRLAVALRRCSAAEVVVADPRSLNGQMRSVMDTCRDNGATLKVVAATLHHDGRAVSYIPGLDCPVFVVQPKPAGWGSYLAKQVIDRVVAVTLLLLLSPLFVVVALLIKTTSRGPVIFVDRRVGLGQRPFDLYKLRTMRADAQEAQADLEEHNEAGGVLFKIRDDPRITGVGRVLRRFSLDELPQLMNVVKGDMSLIGPRPLPLRDCDLMEEWHRRRHVVLPGMTGLAQVSGRSDLDFADMVDLDLRYIDTWSLASDLHIAWLTIAAVVSSRGAY
jgi:exopolysaccharide biosynthesis polyprenyl glycosylphosphotransferase